MDYLIHERKLALPLYPQFGLEPNIYFIPPINVPDAYLEQMFGPSAKKAVETYKRIKEDRTLQGLLVLFGSFEKILHSFKVDGDHAYGYDEKGDEFIKVPVTEPIFVREVYDKKLKSYRHNTP